MEQHRETFNDGFLEYGRNVTRRTEKGKRAGKEFIPEGKLAFRLMNARDSDYMFAGSMGSSLDLKIKTRFPPSFLNISKSDMLCVIDNNEFEVIKVDHDREKRYLYFYLQKVGE
ncbi:head-tail adaptor protein [Bacillus suaedae]|uniref:Head-tail adaptor protein n=1 Tax=Halalkalibacter suaedae TaxID=2822140 RepID=A0A940WZN6_9BACI|nr:head-tail adaptor protein [Bacillus suaedae]MBP3951129.1 head-tail adaptor protein [Bacillus suaedae]